VESAFPKLEAASFEPLIQRKHFRARDLWLRVVFFIGLHLNHLACFLCHLLFYHSNDGFITTPKDSLTCRSSAGSRNSSTDGGSPKMQLRVFKSWIEVATLACGCVSGQLRRGCWSVIDLRFFWLSLIGWRLVSWFRLSATIVDMYVE